ncbi:putative membrane protein [Anaerotaenia torta]|uniref:phage holin family protein n=1 Tax=Anaerotaenia torta TaxID=433293 RepID=UPI003D1DC9E1
MSKLLLKYISAVAAIFLLSKVIPSITIKSIPSLLVMGFVLFLANLLVKPILLLLTLPFNLITFGLFSFIVNAWTIMLSDAMVKGINMNGFVNSLITALVIAILHHLLRDSSNRDSSK